MYFQLEERNKEKINRKDYWLHKDIVVKVVTRKLGNKMYGLKGVITVSVLCIVHEKRHLSANEILLLSSANRIIKCSSCVHARVCCVFFDG